MKAGDSKLCPSCGLRNKPKWEFCARCGESLQDIAVGSTALTPESASAAGDSDGGIGMVGIALGTILVLAALVVAVRWRPSQTRTDPGIFVSPRVAVVQPSDAIAEMPASFTPVGLEAGRAALVKGNAAGAVAPLAQAVANAPNDHTARYAYAQALWQFGDRELALAQYREAARLSPDTVNYRRDLAKALGALGRGPEAIPEYEAALRMQPDSPGYLRELATLYVQNGNAAGAVGLLTRAAELKTGDTSLLQDLGQALERAGDKPAAADAYRRAVQIDPKDAASRALLSEIVFGQGRQEEAIGLVREGLSAQGPSASLYRALGSLLERTGRTQEAAATYRDYAAKAASAADAGAMAERARLLEQSGRS